MPTWVPAYAVALGFFAGLTALVLTLAWPRSQTHHRIRQIAHFGPARRQPKRQADAERASSARWMQSVLSPLMRLGGLEERVALRLERAGIRMRPHEWMLLRAGVSAGVGLALLITIGWVGWPVGLVAGWLATMVFQSIRIDRRANRFADLLPDALQLVIGSLRSGFSLPQSLEAIVRESPDPVAAEIGRALAEHRLGADISDALERVAQRCGSDDLSWAVMGISIQREVGGNLAELLQTTVETMRERARLRRHVRALSAEGRLSAWVLIAIPLLLAVFMLLYRTEYLLPLVTEPVGVAMVVGGGAAFAIGILWMLRVIKVEA